VLARLPPARRRWLASAYLSRRPLPVALEQELVDEVGRCWDGAPLPVSMAGLVDSARLALLLDAVEARDAACAGPAAAGRYLTIATLRPLEGLLAGGRSAMVLSPSFGAWPSIAPALARRGYTVGFLDLRPAARRPQHPRPPGPGLQLIQLPSSGYARELVRFAGQERRVIVAVGDEGCGPRWARAPFLGRSAAVGSTPFEIARRLQLGILPVFALREGSANRLLVERPLKPTDTGNPDPDLDATAARWLKVVERLVRRHPGHYLGFLFTRYRQRSQDPVPLFGDE